jgi:hypothetical protein
LELAGDCKDAGKPVTLANVCEVFKRKEHQLAKEPGTPDLKIGPLIEIADKALVRAETEERKRILDEILNDMETQTNEWGQSVTYDEKGRIVIYKDEIKRLKALSLEDLTRIRDEREERELLHALPLPELRRVANGDRLVPAGFPSLPLTIVRKGTIRPVSLDALYIKRLSRDDLKQLIRSYGPDAVNARLRGE